MKNNRHEGKTLKIVAPAGGLVGGQGYLAGATFGVVKDVGAEGDTVILAISGVFRLAKATGSSTGGAVGARAYWDNTAKKITAVETDNLEVGIFDATCTDAAATADVNLGVRTVPGATSG